MMCRVVVVSWTALGWNVFPKLIVRYTTGGLDLAAVSKREEGEPIDVIWWQYN
jgi:hypothetical protein